MKNYKIVTGSQLRAASGIIGNAQAKSWRESYPNEDPPPPRNYLANGYPDTHSEWQPHRRQLIEAITSRWVSLYRGWGTQELRIKELFDEVSQ